jgi:hypothetical protein
MLRVQLLCLCSLLIACNGSESSSGDDDGGDTPSHAANGDAGAKGDAGGTGDADGDVHSASNEVVGHFDVKLIAATPATAVSKATEGSTTVGGKVYDGPLRDAVIWDQAAEEDGCKLFMPRVPFCDPACGSGAVCVDDGKCEDSPKPHGVGTLHVEGLRTTAGKSAFDIEPINGSYTNGASDALPFPAFDEGDRLSVGADGADYAAFELKLRGIAPLVLAGEGAYALASDEPLALAWTPPGAGSEAHIHVDLDISHHGGSKGRIECDVDDDGEHEIPASLIAQLIDLGVAGYPTIFVRRIAATTAPIEPGLVELEVSMSVERALEIPGLSSCTDDEGCPDGETCQPDLTCQ